MEHTRELADYEYEYDEMTNYIRQRQGCDQGKEGGQWRDGGQESWEDAFATDEAWCISIEKSALKIVLFFDKD